MRQNDRGARWATAAAVAVTALLSASCGSGSTPATQPTSPAPSTAPATSTPTGTPSPSVTPTTPAAFRFLPLWPFASVAAAESWRHGTASGAWQTDAGQTALRFARGYLHIDAVDRVTSRDIAGGDARVGVGFATEGGRTGTAAVVHLVRIGTGADAPWEVVGTDDTTLTLTRPAYGATVGSPVVVGGRVTGVDENLRVKVFTTTAADAVGSACCVPAGGERTPWSMSVSYRATRGQVLTLVVMTGGHLKDVERFAVTGVRAR